MRTPRLCPVRALRIVALAMSLPIAAVAWAQAAGNGPQADDTIKRLVTDDPQTQAARWGVLARMAGKPWLSTGPVEISNVWRNAGWLVPGASMKFQRGFCIALQCQATDYVVQYNDHARRLELFENGAMAYTAQVQDDGSVRLVGTGLMGVLTAETLRYDAATGAMFANQHELKASTPAQLTAATRGFVPEEAPKAAASAASDAELRAELAAMKAKVDQLSKQLEQPVPAPAPAASSPAPKLTPAQLRSKQAEEKRLADAKAREEAQAKARAREEAQARAREEAQAKAVEAQRQAAEKRAQAEQEKRLKAEAQAREAEAKAAEARRLAEERLAQQEAARREAQAKAAASSQAASIASRQSATTAPAAAPSASRAASDDAPIRAGTYSTGTGYSIDVRAEGDSLVIVEPNKRSEYRRIAPGSNVYRFHNPNTGSTFALTVVNKTTLMASKFNSAGEVLPNGTELKLVGGGASQAHPVGESTYKAMEAVAQKYLKLAQTDTANAQAWSFCGLAAMARAHGQNEQQVQQAATALKSIATTSQSPCPDAITPAVWNSVR